MSDMTIRAGGRLSFTINRAEDDAVSATFIMQMDEIIVSVTENYDSDGIASFEIGSPETDVIGEYQYQINENFATGSPDIYPNMDDCDGDCELPTVTICESLAEGS